jgi:hypothetical protein
VTFAAAARSSAGGPGFDSHRNCYYQGIVVGDPRSWVAINTCHGISGVVHGHGETFAVTPSMLEPAADGIKTHAAGAIRHMHQLSVSHSEQNEKLRHPHLVYRVSDYTPLKRTCGVPPSESTGSPAEVIPALESGMPLGAAAGYAGKKYVELFVVNDYDRHGKHGDQTEHDTLALGTQHGTPPAGKHAPAFEIPLISSLCSLFLVSFF